MKTEYPLLPTYEQEVKLIDWRNKIGEYYKDLKDHSYDVLYQQNRLLTAREFIQKYVQSGLIDHDEKFLMNRVNYFWDKQIQSVPLMNHWPKPLFDTDLSIQLKGENLCLSQSHITIPKIGVIPFKGVNFEPVKFAVVSYLGEEKDWQLTLVR